MSKNTKKPVRRDRMKAEAAYWVADITMPHLQETFLQERHLVYSSSYYLNIVVVRLAASIAIFWL